MCTVHRRLLCALYTDVCYVHCTQTSVMCTVHRRLLCALYTDVCYVHCTQTSVMCTVHRRLLCALYTDVCSSHEAVPSLTLKFQTSPHNAAIQTQHAAQTVRTPAVRIPLPCQKDKRALLINFQRSKSPHPHPRLYMSLPPLIILLVGFQRVKFASI